MSDNDRVGDIILGLVLALCCMLGGTCIGERWSGGSRPCREERLSETGRAACVSAEARLEERDGGAVWCRCPRVQP